VRQIALQLSLGRNPVKPTRADKPVMPTLTLPITCRSRILVMRYAGVSIALSIMTAFVEIMALEEKKRARAEQQLKAEEAKTFKNGIASSQKNGGAAEESRVATLRRDLNRLHSSVSAMEARLTALFEHFVARQCREVMPFVRRDVVEALGRWTMACPESFMKDNRLKYIAWGMSDHVRASLLGKTCCAAH
jgi:hypothetical protein